MKINNIKINNVLSYDNEKIDFNKDLNIFIGPNGAGKSNLINIIICIIKRYCFKNFEIHKNNDVSQLEIEKYSISEKGILYDNDENYFLVKHKCLQDIPSSITFNLEFEKQDYFNLLEIKRNKDLIIKFIDTKIDSIRFLGNMYSSNKEDIKKILNITPFSFKLIGTRNIEIQEKNGKWILKNNNDDIEIIYMNYFSVVYEILNIINTEHKVKNNFMFFEAYRNNSQQTTKAGLTNNQYGPSYLNFQPIQNMRNLSNSIGISTSFITQATKKFGQILRESVENGERKIMFEENTEYLDLKKYFLKFGYNLNLECIDINNNVYQFYLLRKGVKVEVDLISSGEREIMNFLFGLFMDKMNDGIIIIDEPELHIHPNWQKKIIDIFKEETKKKNIQIFFVTHSSSFIKYDILNNIFRIYMDKNGYSKHVKLNTSYKTNKEIREALNIINSTNNEKIFFSNYVILVEGITDQIIFNMILKESYLENNTEVEIININGKLNFKKYEQILSKLKIKCFYIGDRDNLKGYPETKKYFNTDSKKVLKEIKEEKTNDYEEFVSSLNKLKINNNKKNSLSVISIYSKIQAKNLSEKTTLSETEEKEIIDHIKNKENQGIYILKRGEIEQYIGILGHNKEKAFEMAVQIANDDKKKNEWKATDESKELYEIVEKIIIDIKNEQK